MSSIGSPERSEPSLLIQSQEMSSSEQLDSVPDCRVHVSSKYQQSHIWPRTTWKCRMKQCATSRPSYEHSANIAHVRYFYCHQPQGLFVCHDNYRKLWHTRAAENHILEQIQTISKCKKQVSIHSNKEPKIIQIVYRINGKGVKALHIRSRVL
jgi:hypothetical protein